MVNEEIKKIVGAGIAGLVVSGLGVGAVMNSKLNAAEDVSSDLKENIKVLNADMLVAQKSVDASEDAQRVLSEQVATLNEGFVNLQTELTARDEEIIDLNAEITAQVANEEVTTASGVSVSGYVVDEISLGDAFTKTLRDDKVEFLLDSEITFNDDEYRVEEQIVIGDTFKTFTSVDDEDFGSTVYAGTDVKDSVEYKYVFKESPDFTTVTADEPLDISILGKDFEIVGVTNESITYTESQTTVAIIGDEVEGVKVINIGEDSVLLQKGDATEVVSTADGEVDVDGVTVVVDNIFYVDASAERMVVLKTGDDLEITVNDGDAMEVFGEPEDSIDAGWVWNIDTSAATESPYIGARLNQKMNDLTDEFAPLGAGQQLVLPNDYAAVTFTGISDVDYNKVSIEFDSLDVTGGGYETVIVINSGASNIVADGLNYDKLYVAGTTVYVKEDGDFAEVTAVEIEQDDDANLAFTAGADSIVIGDITVGLNYSALDITDVEYDGASYVEHDGDLVTYRGDVIYNVEDNVEDDVLEIDLASETVTANIKVD